MQQQQQRKRVKIGARARLSSVRLMQLDVALMLHTRPMPLQQRDASGKINKYRFHFITSQHLIRLNNPNTTCSRLLCMHSVRINHISLIVNCAYKMVSGLCGRKWDFCIHTHWCSLLSESHTKCVCVCTPNETECVPCLHIRHDQWWCK